MNAENSVPSTVSEPTPSFWPRRRFARLDAGPPTKDECGFVIASESDLTPQQLLEHRVVLVVAPPWTGKTWVAREIERACLLEQRAFVKRTPLENLGPGSRLLPDWWEKWVVSQEEALWIVDSIDEDDRGQIHRAKDLLNQVQDLPEACRARLSLLFLCREFEIPEYFRARLAEVLKEAHEFRLLSLDRQSAGDFVKAPKFSAVCELISTNRLASIAALPVVLKVLAQQKLGASLPAAAVWREVLLQLVTRRSSPEVPPRIDDLFEMASQLAVVASFCGPSALADLSSVQEPAPSFDQLVPRDPLDRAKSAQLTLAAQYVFKSTLFVNASGEVRFAQDHTREWLAAFGMQSWQLGRVKPLVTLQNGELNGRHLGLLAILWQVSDQKAVRDWIAAYASGGVVPLSDAAPSLIQALLVLDRVTDLARRSAWGLDFWDGREQLEPFRVPGMEGALTQKLEAENDPLGQQFLLRVAEVIGARAASRRALEIARDPNSSEVLADGAISFLRTAGDSQALSDLKCWVVGEMTATGKRRHSIRALRAATRVLVKRGLWNWSFAARASILWPWQVIDSLRGYLGKSGPGPTPEAAREFLSWAVLELEAGRHELQAGAYRFGMSTAIEEALLAITSGSEFSEADTAASLRLAKVSRPGQRPGFSLVQEAVRRFTLPRRSFFIALIDDLPSRRFGSHLFLQAEDLNWLISEIERRDGRPESLWKHLYFLFQFGDAESASREAAREFMAARAPAELERLDRERAEADQKLSAGAQEKEGSPEEKTYQVVELVERALRTDGWTLEQRFHEVAALCFSEDAGPEDVQGQWIDLPEDLKIQTVALCREAFDELPPTPRTDRYLQGSLVFEAECFQFLVANHLLDLTPTLIAKWLPSVFSVPSDQSPEAINKAFEVHRPSSESALLQWLALMLRIDPDDARSIPVPNELWSAELAGKILDLADGAEIGPDTKAALYWRCSEWQKERVLEAARSWCAQETIPDLRHHGLDSLMVHSPREGLPRLLDLPATEASLERTRWIDSAPKEIIGRLGWVECADLYDFLWQASPPKSSDNDEGFRSVGAVERGAQALRGAILERFSAGIEEPEARAALDELAARIDWIKNWRDHLLTSKEAAELLHRQEDPATGEPWLEVRKVLETIESDYRRHLRSVGDLHDLAVEELRAIGEGANQHLAMLYSRATEESPKRKRLNEDALQAYLYCRLSDRLERRLEKRPTIHINREPLAARNERNDLKLQAESLRGQPLTVVIEVKWNDNREVWAALHDQLGKRYLLNVGHTHGVYLVGVCGEWHTKKRPKGGVPPDVEGHFRLQAAQLEGLTIEPIVLDLRWDTQPPGSPPEHPANPRRKARNSPTPPPRPTASSNAPE